VDPAALTARRRERGVLRAGAADPPAATGHRRAAFAGSRGDRDNAPMLRELLRFDAAAAVADWTAIDDVVMGGMSASSLGYDPAGHAVFAGRVSLARNGGFASVRCRPRDCGAPGATAYLLEARGDGRRYKLALRTDDGYDGIVYQSAFAPAAGVWARVRLPRESFAPVFRGRPVPGAPPLDPARVRQVGFVIADGQEGPFALALRSLAAE
jgi:hypothetical protein